MSKKAGVPKSAFRSEYRAGCDVCSSDLDEGSAETTGDTRSKRPEIGAEPTLRRSIVERLGDDVRIESAIPA